MSRRRASSPIGTGPSPPLRPSSASACSAYGDLVVMEITASTYDVDRMAPGRIAAFAPPLALMGLIYFLSAQPDLNSGLGLVDEIGRKIVHMAEYGLLWWLWSRAFGFRRPVLAAVITLAYAATDEFHQTFVHGRIGSPRRLADRRGRSCRGVGAYDGVGALVESSDVVAAVGPGPLATTSD